MKKNKGKGLFCLDCGRTIPWHKLDVKYETQPNTKDIERVWICSISGSIVKTETVLEHGKDKF